MRPKRRAGLRRPVDRRLRRTARRRHPLAGHGRARRSGAVRDVRGEPAGHDRAGARRPRARLPARPGLRAAVRRRRARARRAAAPARARRTRRWPTISTPTPSSPGCCAPSRRRTWCCSHDRRTGMITGPMIDNSMITAPDRLLHRLEWRVVRRLDGRLQGGYRTRAPGQRSRLRRAAAVRRRRRRPAHRLERDGPAGRAPGAGVHRGPRADRLAGARPVGVDAGRRSRAGASTTC